MFNTGTYVLFDASANGALTDANNGLTNNSGTVQLGGDLVQNTTINGKTFNWGFTADDGGNDRKAFSFNQSSSQFEFGEAANNYAVTGTWYLSPNSQAGYLTFTTYDAPDTVIELGVDANNYSQLRLYNGATTLGVDLGRMGADNWGLTLGDDTNQSGQIRIENWSSANPIELYKSGALRGYISDIGAYFGGKGDFHDGNQAVTAYGGNSGTPGSEMVSIGHKGVEIHNNVSIGGAVSDLFRIGSKDFSPGTTMMALNFEGTPVQAAAVSNTHNVPIEINGTTYFILLASTRSLTPGPGP